MHVRFENTSTNTAGQNSCYLHALNNMHIKYTKQVKTDLVKRAELVVTTREHSHSL